MGKKFFSSVVGSLFQAGLFQGDASFLLFLYGRVGKEGREEGGEGEGTDGE